MKKFLLAAMAAALPALASASTEWTLTKVNWPYQVDTTYHATVGPGTTFTKLTLTSTPRPSDGKTNTETPLMKLFYLTVDLSNPEVMIKSYLANDERGVRMTVPDIVDFYQTDDVNILAAVNSDFFNMSVPYLTNGAAVTDGAKMASMNTSPWCHLMLDAEKIVSWLTKDINFSHKLKFADAEAPVKLVDNHGEWAPTRGSNEFVLNYWGYEEPKKQNQWGCEIYIEPVGDRPFMVGDQEWEIVSSPSAANTAASVLPVEKGQYVLSGNGPAANRIQAMKPGDKFTLTTTATYGGQPVKPDQLSGGRQMILTDGAQIDVSSSNSPRTLVGASEDGATLVLMAIDGRGAGGSSGAYYRLCAAIMQAVGCHDAMEFDGGGSTTIVVEPLGGVQNIPSEDGVLRAVAEAMCVATKAVVDWNVTKIEVVEKNIAIASGASFTPTVFGFNPQGILIDKDVKDYTLECASSPAAISSDGKTFKPTIDGMYALKVNYGQLSTTVPVKVGSQSGVTEVVADAALSMSPNPVAKGSTVNLGADYGTIRIFSTNGAEVGTASGSSFEAPQSTGIYLVVAGDQGAGRLVVR